MEFFIKKKMHLFHNVLNRTTFNISYWNKTHKENISTFELNAKKNVLISMEHLFELMQE